MKNTTHQFVTSFGLIVSRYLGCGIVSGTWKIVLKCWKDKLGKAFLLWRMILLNWKLSCEVHCFSFIFFSLQLTWIRCSQSSSRLIWHASMHQAHWLSQPSLQFFSTNSYHWQPLDAPQSWIRRILNCTTQLISDALWWSCALPFC